ncbi:MAG: hypothetical protein IJM59_13020 [Proteobacteria bacterium]|nr:hypothetical protein [Pseudomonadota bacterium]
MSRKPLISMILFSAALCFAGCVEERNDLDNGGSSGAETSPGVGGSSSSGSGSSAKKYDFLTSDCAAMGGQKLPSGACYIKCSSADDCNEISGTSCSVSHGWAQNYCEPSKSICSRATGFHGGSGLCLLSCNGESDTTSCPSNYRCVYNYADHEYYCNMDTSSGGGGGGYCKEHGCGGIFCSGKCIGCPGC